MKKQDNAQNKYFKIKFSKPVYFLMISIFLLSLASIGVSVYQIARFGLAGVTDYFKYPLLLVISVLCIAVVISMLVKSQYTVNKEYLSSSFGFIKSKFPVKSITSMLLDTDTKKLTVYFGEQFMVLNMAQEWNEEFVRAILAVSPDVEYSFTMTENKPQDEEK